MVCYDVNALFTSVLVDPAISIVQSKLLQDPPFSHKTSMPIPQIITMLEFCLNKTYFLFQVKYFEKAYGSAMNSPIRPLIANLFMEEFEVKTISSAPPAMTEVCG